MKSTKVILFMAMSLNGIFARPDDSEDFLPHYGWDKFVELAKEAGGFIIGRRTYEIVRKNYDDFGFDFLEGLVKIVISKSRDFEYKEDILIADSPVRALNLAEENGLKSIILTGRPSTNTAFAEKGLLDEIIFNIEPVIIGEGIAVFKPEEFDLNLEPLSIERHQAGGYTLHYKLRE